MASRVDVKSRTGVWVEQVGVCPVCAEAVYTNEPRVSISFMNTVMHVPCAQRVRKHLKGLLSDDD